MHDKCVALHARVSREWVNSFQHSPAPRPSLISPADVSIIFYINICFILIKKLLSQLHFTFFVLLGHAPPSLGPGRQVSQAFDTSRLKKIRGGRFWSFSTYLSPLRLTFHSNPLPQSLSNSLFTLTKIQNYVKNPQRQSADLQMEKLYCIVDIAKGKSAKKVREGFTKKSSCSLEFVQITSTHPPPPPLKNVN